MTLPVRLAHVTLAFDDGTPALDDVSLELQSGERLCVLGANGSGKSTLASVICGLVAPDSGTVELVGERVFADGSADLAAYRRARRKLGLVFQNPDDQIVTSVVADDVAFGPENLGLPRDEIARRVTRELHRVALDDYAQADPTRLSGGQKQRVAIAGALAMEPEVLVLDEPGALLDVRGRSAIMRVMGRLARAGATLVHVTHFMDEALEADRVVVLNAGRIVLEGTPEEVFSNDPELIHALGLELPYEGLGLRGWAGHGGSPAASPLASRTGAMSPSGELAGLVATSRADATDSRTRQAQGGLPATGTRETLGDLRPTLIEVQGVSFSYTPASAALDGVSLVVREGESLAIVGQTGSGKSTLLRLLCGLERPDAGKVIVAGNDTATKQGRRAARAAIGYVMQHPERQLFAETVEADVSFGPKNLGLSPEEVERCCTAALELVGLANRRDASPFSLSGGQRRLCALAGILAMEPRILVLDEPTAGLDPRGRCMLRDVLSRLNAAGTTLVRVTHSMEDAAQASRVVVLNQSHILMEGTPTEVFCPEHENLLARAGLGLPREVG